MKLRFAADYRTLVWAFIFFPGAALVQYVWPQLVGWMLPISLYLGFCAGVFSHNHNHCPTFYNRKLNAFYSNWVTIFYGYPIFAWIPTHNLNHHKLVNKAGDATITWRYSKRHTWLIASTYFFVSAYWQSGPIKEYIRKARRTNPALFRQIVQQYATVTGVHLAMLLLAIGLHGFGKGLLVYVFAFGIPAFFALWSMMFINYIQHVHCDPWSPDNHSRNFVGRFSNFWVFNNGFHGVHHENPGAHWSKLPELHAKRADRIHPELCQPSIFWFCIKSYILGMFSDRFRTHQIGRAPYNPPDGLKLELETQAVDAVEVGTNVSIA